MKFILITQFLLVCVAATEPDPRAEITVSEKMIQEPLSSHRRLHDMASEAEKVTPEGVLEFKRQNQLKDDANPIVQEIHTGGHVLVDGQYLSLHPDDLEAVEIFTPDAFVSIDGIVEPHTVPIYASKEDPRFTAAFSNDGTFLNGNFYDGETGRGISIEPVQSGTSLFANIEATDFDEEALSSFDIEDVDGSARRLLRGNKLEDHPLPATVEDDRILQTIGRCSDRGGFDKIQVAVVVDSSFCRTFQRVADVTTAVTAIMNEASSFYRVDGVCKTFRITDIEIHCNPSSDPIRSMISQTASNGDICSTRNSLLNQFVRYVDERDQNPNRKVNADLNLLMHGTQFQRTSSIGCAYVNTVCDKNGFDSGVNYMGFSSNTVNRAKLISHEAGHILGGDHVNDSSSIMNPSVCTTCTQIDSRNRRVINAAISSASCVKKPDETSNLPQSDPVTTTTTTTTRRTTTTTRVTNVCRDSSSFIGIVYDQYGQTHRISCDTLKFYSPQNQQIVCDYVPGFANACPRACSRC